MREIEMNSPDAELAAGDPTLREAEAALPMMPAVEHELPGAVAWETVQDLGVVPAYSHRIQIPGQFSAQWTGPSQRSQVLLQRAVTPTPPPPVILPGLASLTLAPLSVRAGDPAQLTATLTAPWPLDSPAVVGLALPAGQVGGPTQILIAKGQRQGTVGLTTAGSFGGMAHLSATLGKQLLTADLHLIITLPPPPVVKLASLWFSPAQVALAGPSMLMARLTAPSDQNVALSISYPAELSGRNPLVIPAGQTEGQTPVTVVGTIGTYAVTAAYGGSPASATLTVVAPLPPPNPIPTPSPSPPPVERTVTLTGATQAQIQAAIDAATPGTGLYLGPGLYSLTSPSRSADGQRLDFLNKDGVTLFGAGPATVLDLGGNEGLWLRNGGRIGQGNAIRDLSIRNCHRAVCALDPQRLWMLRVAVSNCGLGFASERTSAFDNMMTEWPVVIQDCQVLGWSGHGAMLHGGETVQRCQFIDTPGNQGSTLSHGLYIQGAKNVLIEDVSIENVSGHAWQLYSDNSSHQANGAENIILRRVTCRNGYYGPVIAANGHYKGIQIEDLTVVGTVSRNAGTFVVSATNDFIDQLSMKNVVLDGGGEGLILQSQSMAAIRGMQIEGLVVRNHNVGIRTCPDGWSGTRVENSVIRGYQPQNVAVPRTGPALGLVVE